MKIISAKQAKNAGEKRYFTGKPCKDGHVAERIVSNRQCVDCSNKISRAWAQKNKERYNEIQRHYYLANTEAVLGRSKEWRSKNQEKYAQISKEYRDANREKLRLYGRINWSRRNASELKRTPSWLSSTDRWMIKEIYELAALRSKVTGIKWEVDHIIPLQGKKVSGLHVPLNLRVVPAIENRSKSNKFNQEHL